MKTKEARQLGRDIAALLVEGRLSTAYELLVPVLAQRTPFAKLDLIGGAIGVLPLRVVDPYLDRLALEKTEGGWVVIATTLRGQLGHDLTGTFNRCRTFVIAADVWYATDTLSERVCGPALVGHFSQSLSCLSPWREDSNHWVRRAVGVAVHLWAKRRRGEPESRVHAQELLKFLQPMFAEWEMPAVKGVGWGLKTMGRYYPDLVASWLAEVLEDQQLRYRAHTLRKAMLYLSDSQKARVRGT